jgi:aldehyde:ferredoxin oxidoreductase
VPRGYMGKILKVDLSTRKIQESLLDEETCRDFIGGYGIGARILYSSQKGGVDPLGPENTLGFTTGPLTGTQAISGTRFTVVAKSPLTGGWGDANSGGYFAAYLKFSGYDGVFFTGISEKPVYIFINHGKAELRDAEHLWGKDTYETDDILKSELGNDTAIACIGPSGEKVSLVSCIMHNKGSAAGRSGLGAVMGSKKLKAVAVKGKMKVPVADEQGTKNLRDKYIPQLGGHIKWMHKYGTSMVTVQLTKAGDAPIKNYSGVAVNDFPDAEPIGGEALLAHKIKSTRCYMCPVGCDALLKEGTGEYKYAAGSFRPEYETLVMLGTNCQVNNLEAINMANDICNRYGIDTISAGSIMAFAMEVYEKGLVNRQDTGGIEMTWGNNRALVAMMGKMARREGFGDILADGVKVAAEKIGKGAEKYAIHIQGQEVPGHNPVANFHWANTYITDATPARHTQGSEYMRDDIPFDKNLFTGRGLAHKQGVANQHIVMCTGMCLFVGSTIPSKTAIAEFMKLVTGWDRTMEDLYLCGERIANIRQAFNLREGLNLLNYSIPERAYGNPPQKAGPGAGITVDRDTLVNEYLAEMDWDPRTARPSNKKLLELGMDDVARDLWK